MLYWLSWFPKLPQLAFLLPPMAKAKLKSMAWLNVEVMLWEAKTAPVVFKTLRKKSGSVVQTKQLQRFGALVDDIKAQAVVPKNLGFGKGETKLSPLSTLYAFGQCTRDLAKQDCTQCLAIAVGNYETICGNRRGCRVLYGSCYVRYELYPIFYPVGANSTMNVVADETIMTLLNP
ncbi:PREDICTED: cysteine-rich repeat secretory protein 55-like isoform 2 [Fragaria vesca subsp. vesca]